MPSVPLWAPILVIVGLVFGCDRVAPERARSECRIDQIIDGDSLRCQDGRELRLQCVDAPEWNQHPWGDRAKRALSDAVAGSYMSLLDYGQDRYQRYVVQLRAADGSNPVLDLVEQGAVAVYPRFCTERAYYLAQQRARDAGRGIWSQAGLHQAPWKWR